MEALAVELNEDKFYELDPLFDRSVSELCWLLTLDDVLVFSVLHTSDFSDLKWSWFDLRN